MLHRPFTRQVPGLGMACALAALPGCRSGGTPTTPMSPEEVQELLEEGDRNPNLGKIDNVGVLFVTLDENLRSWRELKTSSSAKSHLQLDSMEEALTRLVYNNFDAILAALVDPTDPEHRVTAAAALGFSKIPAPEEPGGDARFPLVHPRAVMPLIETLSEGNDSLAQNALLSLARLAAPETPLPPILEILVAHHDPEVRSNAAFALGALLSPEDRDVATGPLFAALGDENQKVRLHAVTALGRLKDPSTAGQLVGVFSDDESALVRANAAFVLGKLGDAKAVPFLIQGLNDPKAVIRFYSHVALKDLTGKDLGERAEDWMRWYQGSS